MNAVELSPPPSPYHVVIDAFCYNGEQIAIKRLAYLFDHVDYFIIIEARECHSGFKKDALYFEKYANDFAPFMQKILFYAIDVFPPMPASWPSQNAHHSWMNGNYEAWWRESYQRNMCKYVLDEEFHNKKYILICSDCDEIVSHSTALKLRDPHAYILCHQPVYLEMKLFYYSTNWIKPYHWYSAFVVNDINASHLDLTACRVNTRMENTIYLPNTGWHFSYFMTSEKLQKKLASFAHRECDQKQYSSIEHIESCISRGSDLFNRGDAENLIRTPPVILQDIPAIFTG